MSSRQIFLWWCATLAALRAEVVVPPDLPVEELVRRGLAAEAAAQPAEAAQWFRAAVVARPTDGFLRHKVAKQLSDQTLLAATVTEKRTLILEALRLAEEAVQLAPKDPVCVLSLAVCYGKLGLYEDTRTKIDYVKRVRLHAEEALALDPDYDWAHHVLGRWHHEVAELGATKRFFAGLLYGRFPPASRAEALRHLERAVALAPDCLAHRVELGFVLRADGREAEAREQWTLALALPAREIHDGESKRRATAALDATGKL